MKKFLLVSLTTMLFAVTAWGANVAKIGDTEYPTLAEAVTAANSAEGDVTITMLVTSPSATKKLTISNNITIDGGSTRRTLKNTFSVSAGKTLTLKNVTVNNTVKPSPARTVVLNGANAKLILSDATLEPMVAECLALGVVASKNATLELAEGTSNVIKNYSGSSAIYHAAPSNYSLTITGNGALSVQHVGTGGYAFGIATPSGSSSAKFIINAPNITATSETAGRVFSTSLTGSSVSSGVYSDAPADKLISTGCAKLALTGADAGKYRVFSLTTATATANGVKASIGKTAYSSLAAAISAAQAGDVVTLWADATAASVAKAITITANGYNASAITAGSGYARATIDGGYTFGQVHTSEEDGHTVYTVNNCDEFIFANYAVANGDIIRLANDIAYPTNGKTDVASLLNIKKSITLDGKGHTISGYWKKSADNILTLAINYQGTEMIDVTLQNVTITNNAANCSSIVTFGNLTSLTLENCQLIQQHKTVPYGIFFIGNHQETPANVTINNSRIANTNSSDNGNPLMVNVPINLTMNNTNTQGWRAIYFKFGRTHEGYVCDGARGTVVTANSCLFDGRNGFSGTSNGSSTFYCEDDGITFNLHNCTLCAEQMGTSAQYILGFGSTTPANRRTQDIVMNISGDNTTMNGKFVTNGYYFWAYMPYDPNNPNFEKYTKDYYYYSNGYHYQKDSKSTTEAYDASKAFDATMHITMNITGGTYSVNPVGNTWDTKWTDRPVFSETAPYAYTGSVYSKKPTIPTGYEVKEITTTQNGVTTTLYRVRQKITGDTELNDNGGQNANEDIKVTESVTVANEETKAEYVEVKGGEDGDPVVTVTVPEGKSLEVSNGLDVTGNAEVVAKAGSTIAVGEGGVISEKAENIVIEADANGSASFLLSPEVVVNTTPIVTVKMTAHVGKDENEDNIWHRFAMPVGNMAEAWTKSPNLGTYLYGWDYEANDWAMVAGGSTSMEPFKGYTISVNETEQDVVYTFKGNLAGNTNNTITFSRRGYNFFGNSYTGYMYVLDLLNELDMDVVDGSVWMWDKNHQTYTAVPINSLREHPSRFPAWKKEVAPMQTFILRLMEGESSEGQINYADAIWGNPRYSDITGISVSAPKRVQENSEDTFIRVKITAANGKSDMIDFTEDSNFTDAYDKGYDATKFKNPNSLNIYSTINDEALEAVATDALLGKTISMETLSDINYTLSFEIVEGTPYAIKDMLTGTVTPIAENSIYVFTAQPNTTIEGRFMIVAAPNVTTNISNTSVAPAANGIYTILGQYIGETGLWSTLPSGIYIVNGVKLVK